LLPVAVTEKEKLAPPFIEVDGVGWIRIAGAPAFGATTAAGS